MMRFASCFEGTKRRFGSGAAERGITSVLEVKYSIVGY